MKLISTLVFVSAAFVTGCSWGEGSGSEPPPSSPDAPVSQNVCGDGTCAAAEIGYCEQDCGSGGGSGSGSASTCGNFVCDAGETNATCPNDCTNGGGSGSGSGSGGGDPVLCAITCFADPDFDTCLLNCLGGGGGFPGLGDDSACAGGAPNGTCDASEDPLTCASDCAPF